MKKTLFVRLLAFAVSCMMLLPAPVTGIGDESDADRYDKCTEVVTALGIMEDSLTGDFNGSESVSKGEFAKILLGGINFEHGAYSGNGVFGDILPEDENYDAVMYAHELGIISGNGAGASGANEEISVMQAVKMAVSALGYAPLAELSGAYPAGYTKICETYLDYRPDDYSAVLTRFSAAEMMYELLEAPIMYADGISDDGLSYVYGSKSNRTMLTLHNIVRISGMVTATPFETTVAGTDFAPEGMVNVAGRSLKAADADCYGYFAMEVDAYYRESAENEAIVIVPDEVNKKIIINSGDIDADKSDESKITYYADNKENVIKLGYCAYVLNGVGCAYDSSLYSVNSGIITVIKNTDTNMSTVIIRSCENAVASGVDFEENIYFRSPLSTGETKVEAKNNIVIEDASGSFMEAHEIESGNVLSVQKSADGSIVRITVSDKTVSGSVEKEDSYIIIDGIKYRATCDISDIRAGGEYEFFLNFMDEIVYFDTLVDSERYGYLLEAGKKTGLGSKLILKVLRSSGSVVEYECRDSLRFNGEAVDITNSANTENILNSLYETRILQIKSGKVQQLIRYTTDSEGYVKSLITSAYDKPEGLSAAFGCDNRIYRKHSESFGEFFVDEDTLIFNVPIEADRQKKENLSVAQGLRFGDDESYYIMAYNPDDMMVADVIISFSGGGTGSITIDTASVMFDRITRAVDSEGETVQKLYVYQAGAEKSYYVYEDSNLDFSSVKKGDIIRILTSDGKCIDFDVDQSFNGGLSVPGDFHVREGSYAAKTQALYHMAQKRKLFGSIERYEDDRLIVTAKLEDEQVKALYKPSSFSAITVCDFKEDEIYTVSSDSVGAYASDINPDAKIYVHTRYGIAMTMFIFVFQGIERS